MIHAEKANYSLVVLCRVLHVARSSYYAWHQGEAARQARQAADDALAHEITVLHIASRRTYGVPRIHAELRRPGRRVNRKRIARVMRERDIRGVTRRKRCSLTRPDKKAKPGITDESPGSRGNFSTGSPHCDTHRTTSVGLSLLGSRVALGSVSRTCGRSEGFPQQTHQVEQVVGVQSGEGARRQGCLDHRGSCPSAVLRERYDA